jgi:hypothetical protein
MLGPLYDQSHHPCAHRSNAVPVERFRRQHAPKNGVGEHYQESTWTSGENANVCQQLAHSDRTPADMCAFRVLRLGCNGARCSNANAMKRNQRSGPLDHWAAVMRLAFMEFDVRPHEPNDVAISSIFIAVMLVVTLLIFALA